MIETASSPTGSRSNVALVAGKLVALGAATAYAVVALGLRLVMARTFFLPGQAWIEGPRIPIRPGIGDMEFSVILPAGIKETTFQLFETQYASLPLPPTVAAYLFTYAAFVLPICLVLGIATRLAALGLLVVTMLLQVYVMPRPMVVGACLLGLDPAGADVGRPGRDLRRRPDPRDLPARPVGGFPANAPAAMMTLRNRRTHVFRKRQRCRRRPRDACRHWPGQRGQGAVLRP